MPREWRSPAAYVQGPGVVDDVGIRIEEATEVLFLADEVVHDIVGDRVVQSLARSGIDADQVTFGGECTAAEIERVSAHADGSDGVVAAGGGKTLDVGKAVRDEVGGKLVNVPTVASTDAPISSLSVIYTADGEFERFRFYDEHPDVVLVDTAVVAAGPTRLFRSGVADAIATWFEADTAIRSGATNVFDAAPSRAAAAIARECYEVVREHGPDAVAAVERDAVDESVEAVVEANTLLSGIGFESGGLAAAHAVHDGLTQLEATHGATHGEKVNVGTLAQLVMEDRSDEFRAVLELSVELGLPVTLAEIGVTDPSPTDLWTVAESACAPGETIHNEPFEVTPERVREALETADRRAREYLDSRDGIGG